jgi:hypothetical protein
VKWKISEFPHEFSYFEEEKQMKKKLKNPQRTFRGEIFQSMETSVLQ